MTPWTVGLVIIFCTTVVVGKEPPGIQCMDCHEVRRPQDCTQTKICHHDEVCATDLHQHKHGDWTWAFHCKKEHDCWYNHNVLANMIGRKRGHPPPDIMCSDCCSGHECNKLLCPEHLVRPTQAPPTTTTMPTTAATTHAVYDANCYDREEDGFTCAELELFRVCTDNSKLSYVVANHKCRKHCGICKGDPNAPTTAAVGLPPVGVCADFEQDGLNCSSMDQFNFCADQSSIAFVMAHEKCRKHCGFCTVSGSGGSVTKLVTANATTKAATTQTVKATTTTQLFTATRPQTTTHQTATQAPVPTASKVCENHETNGFSCTWMDAFNICNATEPMFQHLAHDKCSKHCGLCT